MSTKLAVQVLATTIAGTARALQIAKRLTSGLEARVVLLVPSETSFSTAPISRAAIVHRCSMATRRSQLTSACTSRRCGVCRRVDDVARQLAGGSSLVVVGGRRRLWWPTPEQRLVDRLTRTGCPVVFADVAAIPSEVPVPALVA